jgi:parvulin-like peptidyl-prolyl isomerase
MNLSKSMGHPSIKATLAKPIGTMAFAVLLTLTAACSRESGQPEARSAKQAPPQEPVVAVASNGVVKALKNLAPDAVILAVNGAPLIRREFEDLLERRVRDAAARYPNQTQVLLEAFRHRFKVTIIDEFVAQQVLLQEAARRGFSPSEAQLAEARRRVPLPTPQRSQRRDVRPDPVPDNTAALEKDIQEQACILALREVQFGNRLKVTEQEVRERRKELERQNTANTQTNLLRKAQAEGLLQRLRTGAAFGEVASEAATSGICTNDVLKEQMLADFTDLRARYVLRTLPVNEVSAVTDTEEGWAIFKMLTRKPPEGNEPEKVTAARILLPKEPVGRVPSSEMLQQQLMSRKQVELELPWIEELKKKARVDYPNGHCW